MPLPLGHIAIGLATNDLITRNSSFSGWKLALCLMALANLPDVDVAVGLLLQGNGSVFHRGPTHSILFASLAGILMANAWRLWAQIPKIEFKTCFLVILSHVIGDHFFTNSAVSFFWPLEANWSEGYTGWNEVIVPVFLSAHVDAGIILACLAVMVLNRVIVPVLQQRLFPYLTYRPSAIRHDSQKEQ